jgi:hypothetical protein
MNEIAALTKKQNKTKKNLSEFCHPFHSARTQQETAVCKPGSGPSSDTDLYCLGLGFPVSKIRRNEFLLFINHPAYGTFVVAAD